MRPLHRLVRSILPILTFLAIGFIAACQNKNPTPPPPPPTAQPSPGPSLPVSRLLGLSLNGQSVEQIATNFQDPQSLETQDLNKAFGIEDSAYLERVMKLVGDQIQSGSPLKWIGVYFGGAPKALAANCAKDAGGGICLIEPYAFNCADALSQRNWTEENYLKLCQRLGRLKAYKSDRLVAIFSGDNGFGSQEEIAAPPKPATDKKPLPSGKGKGAAAASSEKPVPIPTSSETKPGARSYFPETIDLLRYLQSQGMVVALISEQTNAAALAMIQGMGLNLPTERIAGRDPATALDSKLAQILRIARAYVADHNHKVARPEDQLNLEDLRVVMITGDDWGPANEPGVSDTLAFLENASSVPGGADLLFLHRHVLEADQKVYRKRDALENFQSLLAELKLLHPMRFGVAFEQPVVTSVRVPGGKGGFLSQNPAAAPESLPTESQATESLPTETQASESQPSGAESKATVPTPGVAPTSPMDMKPATLPQLPPAPPPNLGKDAL